MDDSLGMRLDEIKHIAVLLRRCYDSVWTVSNSAFQQWLTIALKDLVRLLSIHYCY